MDQQLLVFVTVVEKESFSRAAEELRMTQPAVSQYVRSLEQTIGTRLLERTNKFVRLNKAGEIVYHHAKEILGLYTRMHRLVDDLMNIASGNLSIGASYTFGEYILPHILADLRWRYPLIQPTITIGNTREVAELVVDRQLDAGIVEGEYNHEKLHIERFAEDEMVIIASADHPLAGREEVMVTDIRRETWLVREEGSGTREASERLFAKLGFYPDHLMAFGSTQLIKESVEAGLGISLLSQLAILKELKLGKLRVLNTVGTPIRRQFSLMTQTTQFRTKALDVFLDMVKQHPMGAGTVSTD